MPVEREIAEEGARQVDGETVVGLKGVDEVLGVCSGEVLEAEVVNAGRRWCVWFGDAKGLE